MESSELPPKKKPLNTLKKSRGRPISFCRETLVNNAMEKFWDKGYHSVSLNELAKENGLTRASLYNCFASKEALFIEALEQYFKTNVFSRFNTVRSGESITLIFHEVLSRIVFNQQKNSAHDGCLVINSANELIGDPQEPLLSEYLRDIFTSQQKTILQLVEMAIEQGELDKKTQARALSSTIFTFICGFVNLTKTLSDEQEMYQVCYYFMSTMGFDFPKKMASFNEEG